MGKTIHTFYQLNENEKHQLSEKYGNKLDIVKVERPNPDQSATENTQYTYQNSGKKVAQPKSNENEAIIPGIFLSLFFLSDIWFSEKGLFLLIGFNNFFFDFDKDKIVFSVDLFKLKLIFFTSIAGNFFIFGKSGFLNVKFKGG